MKKSCKIIFLLFSLPFGEDWGGASAQTASGIEWQNTIGGSNLDRLYSICQTADSGYICGGRSLSNISGDKTENNLDTTMAFSDYWIVKTDASGNIQWQNTLGGNLDDDLHSISQTADGGFICGGYSTSDSSGDKTEDSQSWDYWVIKLDILGNIQWQNTIGGNDMDQLNSISQTADGGYICGGNSRSNISGDKTENCQGYDDYWVVKLDASGIIQWQNTIGGSLADYLFSISQTADGGYICGGFSASDISGDKTENAVGGLNNYDYWVIKLDTSGNIQWQKTIGGNDDDFLYSISQTTDGESICGGYSSSNISGDKTEDSQGYDDYWVVKLDSTGNIQWQNTIGGSNADLLYSISQTADGGFICGGYSMSNISGDKTENNWDTTSITGDYWVVKLDTLGNIQWQNTLGGNNRDELYSVLQTTDGGYICGGYSQSNISGDKTENCIGYDDYWIVKLAPDTTTSISQLPQLPNYQITISPNPLTTQSKLTFKNPTKEKFIFTLYDITGRITESVSTTNNEIILTKGSKQPGVYLFNLVNEKTGESQKGKIIVQ